FQAEDGIRDFHVTGVQTCALPILGPAFGDVEPESTFGHGFQLRCELKSGWGGHVYSVNRHEMARQLSALVDVGEWVSLCIGVTRSEERRVGEECRSGWSRDEQRTT